MQENAQKKSDMYGGFDETQKMLTSSLGAGKVSQVKVLCAQHVAIANRLGLFIY